MNVPSVLQPRTGLPPRSANLFFTPLAQHHARLLHPAITASLVQHWIGWEPSVDLAGTEAWVSDACDRRTTGAYLGWLAFRHTAFGPELVGMVSLENAMPPAFEDAPFELNVWVASSCQGHGYGLEMSRAVLGWLGLFTNVNQLEMSWTEGNRASQAMVERLARGQRPVTTQREKRGTVRNVFHYRLSVPNKSNSIQRCLELLSLKTQGGV